MNQVNQIRPSLWHLLWGAPFILGGAGFFGYTLFHGLMHITDSLTQIVVPGRAELSLKGGQRYTVFLEEESVVNGKIYSSTQSISGLACRVTSVQTGADLGIGKPGMNTTYDVGGRSGRSVLEFTSREDGKYAFACDYGENAKGPEAVVAVGSGVGEGIFRMVGGGLGWFFGGGGAGLIVVLVVLMKREREKKRMVQAGQAQV